MHFFRNFSCLIKHEQQKGRVTFALSDQNYEVRKLKTGVTLTRS